jgi:hypothetical protein
VFTKEKVESFCADLEEEVIKPTLNELKKIRSM